MNSAADTDDYTTFTRTHILIIEIVLSRRINVFSSENMMFINDFKFLVNQ